MNDQDWFAVELVTGQTYVVDLEGSQTTRGTLQDPYLRGIHDVDGNLISGTSNDDANDDTLNSRVTFTPTADGTHYIAVGAYDTGVGTYTLSVRETEDVMGAAPIDTGLLELVPSDRGTFDEPYLYRVFDADGDFI